MQLENNVTVRMEQLEIKRVQVKNTVSPVSKFQTRKNYEIAKKNQILIFIKNHKKTFIKKFAKNQKLVKIMHLKNLKI